MPLRLAIIFIFVAGTLATPSTAKAGERRISFTPLASTALADQLILAMDPWLMPDSDLNPRAKLRENLAFAKIDLNDDGIPEVIVFLPGPYGGSGGNTTYALATDGKAWRVIANLTTHGDILVLPNKDKGWRRLRDNDGIHVWFKGGYVERRQLREATAKCIVFLSLDRKLDPCAP